MDYKVAPGPYAVGEPDDTSPVLVTANYKLTFDALRSQLTGVSAWVLVLDTHGINVWCAAGKGTFGTAELISRIRSSRIAQLISHRTLVLPQLGAPGVAAHEVRQATGFRVKWGPIRAEDIPAYLEAGMKTTPGMRAVTFTARERTVLTPIELLGNLSVFAPAAILAALAGGVADAVSSPLALGPMAFLGGLTVLGGVVAGAVVTPVALPLVPARAFSAKGAVFGVVAGAALAWLVGAGALASAAAVLACTAVSSFAAMNYTGTAPFTSLSGVDREMRRWMPIQAGLALIAIVLWVAAIIAERSV